MTLTATTRERGSPLWIGLAAAAAAAFAAAMVSLAAPGMIRPAYVVSGALVGVLVGLTGVGGGSLMTPLLILVFGVHPASAVGTDLLYASATKTVGTGVHASNRTVDWRLVGWLACGSIPATILTAALVRLTHFGGDKTSHALSVMLGVILVLTAMALFVRERLARFAQARSPELSPRTTTVLTVGLGVVLGVLITLTSVGAGALGVTALVFLHPRMPLARIVGSDIAHAVPLTLIAGAAHWLSGSVEPQLLVSLLCGSAPGIVVGSLLTPRMSDRVLRPILATVLVLVGVKLVT